MKTLGIKALLVALAFIAPASAYYYYRPVYRPVVYREVPVVCERELVQEVPVVRERVYVEQPVMVRPVRYKRYRRPSAHFATDGYRRPHAHFAMDGYRGGFGFSFGF